MWGIPTSGGIFFASNELIELRKEGFQHVWKESGERNLLNPPLCVWLRMDIQLLSDGDVSRRTS